MLYLSKLRGIFSKKPKVIEEHEKRSDVVCRSDKLNEVKELLTSSRPACVFVEGKAGVGKSYFLQTLVEDLEPDHFVIFRKIERSENEKIVFVLGELIYKLKHEIEPFPHWNVDKEIVIEATESMLKWMKNILKIPDEIPVDKIPSYVAGIDKEKYERVFIHEFKDALNNLLKYIPSDRKMVIILDQVERLDQKELPLLYDVLEGLPERILILLASKRSLPTPEIIAKIKPQFLTIGNFSEKETEKMLELNGIPHDETFLKKLYHKYDGYPLLLGMALNEMKVKENYDLDLLPENLERYFEGMLKRISFEDANIVRSLALIRESLEIDALCSITNEEFSTVLKVLEKEENLPAINRTNHRYELFHSLFSDFVRSEIENISPLQFKKIHESAAEYYASKLQEPSETGPDELVFSMVEAPYHACKAKSPKLLELIWYSSKFKTMWGYIEEAKEEFETAYNLYQKNDDKKGMSYMLTEIGVIFQNRGKPEQALEYYQNALEIAEELKDVRGKATMLNNIGRVYQDWGKHEQALEYYQNALKIAEELKDIRGKAKMLNNIGRVYQDWGKHEQALEYYQNALEIFEELKDKRSAVIVKWNINSINK